MKLRNKKTGEIVEFITGDTFEVGGLQIRSLKRNPQIVRYYPSLAELNEEWEDYEEPKEYWYIDYDGGILCGESDNSSAEKMMISMGNHFETIVDAEMAVEKLKAWKRLKDKGFRFSGKEVFSEGLLEIDGVLPALKRADNAERLKIIDDLDLLFGGEE